MPAPKSQCQNSLDLTDVGLFLIGAGGHGRVVADTAECAGFTEIVFLDDRFPNLQQNLHWPVVGTLDHPVPPSDFVFLAIGDNKNREIVYARSKNHSIPIVIHPFSCVSSSAKLHPGVLCAAASVVQPGARIGTCTILNTACTVDHDCTVGDFVHISPGAHLAGNVVIGDGTWVGIGSAVKEGVTIGENSIVAAGAVVTEHVPANTIVMGVPAKTFDQTKV